MPDVGPGVAGAAGPNADGNNNAPPFSITRQGIIEFLAYLIIFYLIRRSRGEFLNAMPTPAPTPAAPEAGGVTTATSSIGAYFDYEGWKN